MTVALVNPPRSASDLEEVAPPLGLLRLARVAHELGHAVYVEDYNLLWHLDAALQAGFYERATNRLLALEADVYGFTSMAVDSHVALELARRLKALRPHALMLMGGPHFSSIAADVMTWFPWVDRVVVGEGEGEFGELLGAPSAAVAAQGRGVPRPLYDVVRLPAYFHVNPARLVNLEAGRGCRFKCTFCYSPGHYRLVADFATEHVLANMSELPGMGVRHVWFVEDNFLNDSARTLWLCDALREARFGVTWSCYATFPQLTEQVVGALAAAGCTEIFCGIDAVGRAAEQSFHKAFLRGRTSLECKTRWLVDAGITPTYAFLVAPPSHPAGRNLTGTALGALEARVAGAETVLNPLNLYPGTLARGAFQGVWVADWLQSGLMMDVPDIVQENHLADAHPALFPFHARYVGEREWRSFLTVTHCLATLTSTYPKTLSGLHAATGADPVHIAEATLERFKGWERLTSVERQRVEQDVGYFVLEEQAAGSGVCAALEEERASAKDGTV